MNSLKAGNKNGRKGELEKGTTGITNGRRGELGNSLMSGDISDRGRKLGDNLMN